MPILLTSDNLQHLIEISGWSITQVQGSKIEMILEKEVIISFDTQELAKGGSAKVRAPTEIDPIRQFSFSALTPKSLKGDVRKVDRILCHTKYRSSIQCQGYTTSRDNYEPNWPSSNPNTPSHSLVPMHR